VLEVKELVSGYGDMTVLRGLSLDVRDGEIVALFGPNGHGKSTLLKTIAGLHPPKAGSIKYQDRELANLPSYQIIPQGIAYIPENRDLFPGMTVNENLKLGAYCVKDRKKIQKNLSFCYEMFPRLAERKNQLCLTLSGGEARMVAIARGLMSGSSLLLLDEPSIGLAPILKESVFRAIQKINQKGHLTVLVVEQEIDYPLAIADRVYLLKRGRILFERPAAEVDTQEIEDAYF
jgi:branched-chain amino acid transport system ATP-binding protein